MNKEKSESLYQQLAVKLIEGIPVQWGQILFYAEVQPGVTSIYLVFHESESNRLKTMTSLTKEYSMDSQKCVYWRSELSRIVSRLSKTFVEEGDERWTTMTFVLNNDGKFKVDFGYEDLEATDEVERRLAWKAKYL